MKKIKNSFLSKLTSIITIFALILLFAPIANAASITSASDTMSREKASTKSVHKIVFTSTTAMVAAGTIAINFNTFTGTIAVADVQICHGATTGLEHGTPVVTGGTACTAVDETMSSSNGASTQWGAVYSGTTLTLTAPSGSWTNLISAGQKVTVFVSAANITNPAASTPSITITNSNGDSGSISVPIIDDDQVSVTATVNQSITFDIDTATTNTDTNPLYSVALGTLTTSNASNSDGTTINSIWLNLGTNASGGANVSVISGNGALKSISTPADSIPSATATMAPDTANYGICVKAATAGTGTLTKASPFNGATCTYGHTDTVGALTTSPQNIITSTAPVGTGRVEIIVAAENQDLTPAHADYADTQTYIATATF